MDKILIKITNINTPMTVDCSLGQVYTATFLSKDIADKEGLLSDKDSIEFIDDIGDRVVIYADSAIYTLCLL